MGAMDAEGTKEIFHEIMVSLFGPDWANAWTAGIGGPIAEMWSHLYFMYNGAVIATTCVVLLYTIYAGVVETAHEGIPLGRHFSKWVPVRLALGAALVTPIKGICLVQIIVLWFAGIGNSLASSASSYIINYITNVKPLAPYPYFDTNSQEKKSFVASAVAIATCMAYETNNGHDMSIEDKDSGYAFGKDSFFNLGGGYCGKLEINAHSDYTPEAKKAILDIYKSLLPIGTQIANNQEVQPGGVSSDLYSALETLRTLEKNIHENAVGKSLEEEKERIDIIQNDIKNYGWAALGSWYFFISQLSNKYMQHKAIKYSFEIENLDEKNPEKYEYIKRAFQLAKEAGFIADQDVEKESDAPVAKFFTNMAKDTVDYLNGDGDPYIKVYNIITFIGNVCIGVGGGSYIVDTLTNLFVPSFGEKAEKFLSKLEFLFWIGVILISTAQLLILIPFGIWVVGVLSIIISVVMAFFAAPLWGAAHCLPSGEGLLHHRSLQGYFGALALVLRPFLAVLGYILSIFVLWGGAKLVSMGLKMCFVNFIEPGHMALTFFPVICGILVGLAFCVFLAVSIMYKSFEFIFQLGDHVLEWVGGGTRPLGTDPYVAMKGIAGVYGYILGIRQLLSARIPSPKGTAKPTFHIKKG
jgi:hypothetical protein